jgi:hypothetical protein
MKPRDASPMDPREGNKKILSTRNKRDPKKNNKTRPSQEDRGSHHELAYYVHEHLTV